MLVNDADANWDSFEKIIIDASNKYQGRDGIQIDGIDKEYAIYVSLAVLQAELQAAQNLLGNDVYLSLRKHIITLLSRQYIAEQVNDALVGYQSQFIEALERGENPIQSGIASGVYSNLNLPEIIDGDYSFQSPMVLLAISSIITAGIGSIKILHDKYNIVPD